MVRLNLKDKSEEVEVILWNRVGQQVIGKSADELDQNQDSCENNGCPSEIQALLRKKFVFNIQIKVSSQDENERSYSIEGFSHDSPLIEKHLGSATSDDEDDGSDFDLEIIFSKAPIDESKIGDSC